MELASKPSDTSLVRKEGGKNSLVTAHKTEQNVITLLKGFHSITSVWKDRYNSKFDIFYILKNETVTRGLQVKSITPLSPSKPRQFVIGGLDKYEDGMLMVALNYQRFGLVYTNSRDYSVKKVTISLRKPARTIFNKLILEWGDFLKVLEESLSKGIVVTPKLYEMSLGDAHLKEYYSVQRFTTFCQKHGLNIEVVDETTSVTDLVINGFKVQMKYCTQASPSRIKAGRYAYEINLHRSGQLKYKKGDNDFYVIELGANPGYFLWLPEYLLIKKGFICETGVDEKRTNSLCVYPHDYVEKRKEISPKNKNRVKGGWSCDPKLWISTEHGCMSSHEDVDIYLNNLSIDPDKKKI